MLEYLGINLIIDFIKMKKEDTILLIVDIQEKFVSVIKNIDNVVSNVVKLIKAFNVIDVPIIVTEQYSNGLGSTVENIRKELKSYKPMEKIEFNCFGNTEFDKVIKNKNIKNIVLCGIESHICVTQTLIDGISKGYNIYLVKDAVSSRKESDLDIAIERAKQEGAKIASTEMIVFQLLKKAGTKEFKEIQKIIK